MPDPLTDEIIVHSSLGNHGLSSRFSAIPLNPEPATSQLAICFEPMETHRQVSVRYDSIFPIIP
jgi:hypothetical protein